MQETRQVALVPPALARSRSCISLAARCSHARIVSSVDAYVLPHAVDIAPAHEGFVARVLVRDRDVVSTGQELIEIARRGERSIVRSSAPGVVSRLPRPIEAIVDVECDG
jgi:multidrug resistance efflux pump